MTRNKPMGSLLGAYPDLDCHPGLGGQSHLKGIPQEIAGLDIITQSKSKEGLQ
jgi:hypothetical protein